MCSGASIQAGWSSQLWFQLTRSNSGQHRVNSVNRVNSGQQQVRVNSLVRSAVVNGFGSGQAAWSDSASDLVDSVKPSQLGQPGQLRVSTQSTQLTRSNQSTVLANTVECTLASRALETTSRSRKLASFAREYSGYISKLRHGWNRRTMKSRVLSGVQFPKRLRLFASAVQ
ncbi:hypothetical protein HanRHA438_Chr13g0593681 [Helianthus annuus]|uniref:Uncharacterized protein n=1 Tax=Helianthus annuus TaxID=4232 RepID=A0A251SQJ2_HELAN|nr:hypothetical protein HanXRQr2_Chr13g0582971 [Helianthus annuus]KAF5772931.1 hypothetical protein HanXRQr2_Chr13g0582981 [Helianthus annuus]KAJ0476485.1 hypothetical protein HanHA300_Chr13g0477911 [Helianthus annuus]KAJ0497312.1 hypothetical protein HanHA89_Chr13g0510021 [Helianthus annuus]KAJ0848750.1 hypothetical protein HanPSC8_Chr13g0561121 [Helianthus annuus]